MTGCVGPGRNKFTPYWMMEVNDTAISATKSELVPASNRITVLVYLSASTVPVAGLAGVYVRRGKALIPSGCETRPATVAPAGSSRGDSWRKQHGLKHPDVKGSP